MCTDQSCNFHDLQPSLFLHQHASLLLIQEALLYLCLVSTLENAFEVTSRTFYSYYDAFLLMKAEVLRALINCLRLDAEHVVNS